MGTSNQHGPHFDAFLRQSGSPHGGALFDDGFTQQEGLDTHGKLFDQFDKRPGVERYGERFDEFGWQEMPTLHGSRFDEGFEDPSAHDSPHATWFDAFRGGAQVRYRSDGADYEGVVIDCNREFATVRSREGKQHELLHSQVYAWRDHPTDAGLPSRREATRPAPGEPNDAARGGSLETIGHGSGTAAPSKADAPSAHSHTAHGGGERAPVDAGLVDQVFANKVWDGDLDDVAKLKGLPKGRDFVQAVTQHKSNLSELASAPRRGGAPKLACPGCGKGDNYHVGHTPKEKSPGGPVTSTMYGHCKGCGFKHNFPPPKYGSRQGKLAKTAPCPGCEACMDDPPVFKSVDSSETATQERDETDSGGKAWCPTCKHFCRRDKNGKCPTCGGKVQQKKAEKSAASDDDVIKGLREYAATIG